MPSTARIGLPLALALSVTACSETLDAGATLAGEARVRATLSAPVDAATLDQDYLYFTCEDGWLYRLAKAGADPAERLTEASAPGSVYTNGLAVDDAYVYWTALGDGVNHGVVARAPKAGGAAQVLTQTEARPLGIAVDEAYVYWVDEAGVPVLGNTQPGIGKGLVARMPKDGSALPTTLAATLTGPDVLALDDASVYWHDAQTITRVPKAGGKTTTLFHAPVSFRSSNLIVTGGRVFWAGSQGAWTLESVSTKGGAVTALAADIDQPSSLALFDGGLAWAEASGPAVAEVLSVPIAGGSPTMLWPANPPPGAQDGRALFLLADERALYSVESRSDTGVSVAIRVLPR